MSGCAGGVKNSCSEDKIGEPSSNRNFIRVHYIHLRANTRLLNVHIFLLHFLSYGLNSKEVWTNKHFLVSGCLI